MSEINDSRARIRFSEGSPFEPLLDNATRYTIITGGRGSGKSFAVATALINETFKDDGTILFTRYTLVNAEDSVMPEFIDKINRLHLGRAFVQSGNDIINLVTGGKILFRGIKVSNKINTAALKSIPKLKMWVLDEGEELVDESVFDTIDLSIRPDWRDGSVCIILNPTDVNHFIYRKFFAGNGVEQVCNRVKGDVTYIHTTYLGNSHLSEDYKKVAEKCKATDRKKYENLWLGEWTTLSEGAIYSGWKEIAESEYPTSLHCWYGVDWGYSNDPAAVVRICFDEITYTDYVKELLYERGLLTGDIARVIREDIMNRRRTLAPDVEWKDGALWHRGEMVQLKDLEREACYRKVKEDVYNIQTLHDEIYCDPARPDQIRELRLVDGLMALPAVNTEKTGRIEYLKYFDIRYVGANIKAESESYRWRRSATDRSLYVNVPEDGNDHLMDAINYGIVTHQRQLGIANKIGDK